MTTSPDFLNRVFVMRLPEPMGAQHSPQFTLQCNLFATPTMQGTAGRGGGGGRGNVWQGTAGTWEGKEGSFEKEDMGDVRMAVLHCIRILTPECASLSWSALRPPIALM